MTHAPILDQIGCKNSLRRGAENAILGSLSVKSNDRVVIICDEASASVGAAILAIVNEQKAHCDAFILERLEQRPVAKLPDPIKQALNRATVSLYLATSVPHEYPHRNEILEIVNFNRIRHAHMINIDETVMCQGMLTDFHRVKKLNNHMIDLVKSATKIRVTSRLGTDVQVALDPTEPWLQSAGVIQPGHWENLPNGEVLSCPSSVDGIYVCDNMAPTKQAIDRFELGRTPLKIHLKEGRIEHVEGGPGDLAIQVIASTRSGINMDRIGMFAIGTNYELLMPIGNRLQDMFVPGVYFSVGRYTGDRVPSWTSTTQHIFQGSKTSLILDDVKVISDGKYSPSILSIAENPS